jgi:hypothetical protein
MLKTWMAGPSPAMTRDTLMLGGPAARGFAIAQRRAVNGVALMLEPLGAFRPSLGEAVPGLSLLSRSRCSRQVASAKKLRCVCCSGFKARESRTVQIHGLEEL